ncbi:MAG: TetR/AcrR family transcriptional regulator [Maricaulaceae bacterium]
MQTAALTEPSRRQLTEDKKRRHFLQVAQRQFLKHGYDGTSIGSIIDITGGSKSTIYKYFGNKEQLFSEVILATSHDYDLELLANTEADIHSTLVEYAKDRLRQVYSEDHIRMVRIVIAEAERFPDIARTFFTQAPKIAFDGLSEYLATQSRKGRLVVCAPHLAAEAFLGGLLMKGLLGRLFDMTAPPSDADITDRARAVTDAFLAVHGADRRQ